MHNLSRVRSLEASERRPRVRAAGSVTGRHPEPFTAEEAGTHSQAEFERLRDEYDFTGKVAIVKNYVTGWPADMRDGPRSHCGHCDKSRVQASSGLSDIYVLIMAGARRGGW